MFVYTPSLHDITCAHQHQPHRDFSTPMPYAPHSQHTSRPPMCNQIMASCDVRPQSTHVRVHHSHTLCHLQVHVAILRCFSRSLLCKHQLALHTHISYIISHYTESIRYSLHYIELCCIYKLNNLGPLICVCVTLVLFGKNGECAVSEEDKTTRDARPTFQRELHNKNQKQKKHNAHPNEM